jgi:hypothetical protein
VKLRISDDLSLPLEAASSTYCIVGIRNSGKSTTAVVMAEEFIKAKQQVVVFDPTDTWWGLRSGRDGGEEGGLPLTVLGGRKGDAPLESTAGELVADLIVDEHISFVLSLRHFSDGEKVRFVTALCARLYKRNQDPLSLIFDEANLIAPQVPQRGEEQMLGLVKRITMQGRTSGLNPIFISQRPAALNKNVMTQCETLIAMRTIGLQDRNAVEEWVKAWAQNKEQYREAMDNLATFPQGTGLYWTPGKMFKVVRFRQAETFDSRRSPKAGERLVEPRALAPVDLKLLTQKMAATIERAKADDPRELRKQVAELKKQLSTTAPTPVDESVIENAVVRALSEERERWVGRANNALRLLSNARPDVAAFDLTFAAFQGMTQFEATKPAGVAQKVEHRFRKPEVARSTRVASSNGHISDTTLDKAGRKVLTVLAQHSDGCAIGKLALLSGYRISGGFRNTLSALRKAGFIVGDNTGIMSITDDGLAALGGFDALPTGAELAEYWLTHSSFGSCEKQTLQAFLLHPKGLDMEQAAKEAGYQVSGGFRNALSSLRTAGVIVGKNTEVMRANEDLFD